MVAWVAKGIAGPSVSHSAAKTILSKKGSTGVGQVRFCCGNAMLSQPRGTRPSVKQESRGSTCLQHSRLM